MNIEKYNKLHNELMRRLESGEIAVESVKEVHNLVFNKYIVEASKSTTYDKASWHIDNGMDEKDVLAKFNTLFKFFKKNNMLSKDGKEIISIGIDESVVITSSMLNNAGNMFMNKYYDKELINLKGNKLLNKLDELYTLLTKEEVATESTNDDNEKK